MPAFIKQPGGVAVILKGHSYNVSKTDKAYEKIVEAIQSKASDDDILNIINHDKIRMEKATEVVSGVTLQGGQLFFQDEPIAGVLGERMLQMLDEGFDLKPMANFLEKLLTNPSNRVVENLYSFLEVGKNAITEDGCFLAYKAVRENYTDIRTGNFDNSVGKSVAMPRHRVDENPNNTCSSGLHVCSYDYLPHFAHADGHVVVCKVSPADVVAIPADYNNTKMRVSRYEVVDECKGYYSTPTDVLGSVSVRGDRLESAFAVEVRDVGEREFTEVDSSDSLLDAAMSMKSRIETDTGDIGAIRITNRATGAVIDEKVINVDEADEAEDAFTLFGISEGTSEKLDDGFDNISDAVIAALDYTEDYDEIQVRNASGQVVKTIA